MTPDQIALIRNTFQQVDPDAAAEAFYARLFEIAPDVRSLFASDLMAQGQKLMATLAVVVNGLNDIDALMPTVRELGARHADYGAEPAHYDAVGAALLWTLEQGLGAAFTDDAKAAWAEAYGVLSSTMIDAAEGKAA